VFPAILDYLFEKYSGKVFNIILKEMFEDCLKELRKYSEPSFEELLEFSENRIQNFLKCCYESYSNLEFSENRIQNFLKCCYESYSNAEYLLEVIDLEKDYRKIEKDLLKKFSEKSKYF
jgi:hypothetical protein